MDLKNPRRDLLRARRHRRHDRHRPFLRPDGALSERFSSRRCGADIAEGELKIAASERSRAARRGLPRSALRSLNSWHLAAGRVGEFVENDQSLLVEVFRFSRTGRTTAIGDRSKVMVWSGFGTTTAQTRSPRTGSGVATTGSLGNLRVTKETVLDLLDADVLRLGLRCPYRGR